MSTVRVSRLLLLPAAAGGNDDLKDAAAHIAATPVTPVHDWALPFEDARLPHDYKRKTYPWEIAREWWSSAS